MKRIILRGLVALLLLLLLGAFGAYRWLTRSGLPQRSGEAVVTALTGEVQVRFDAWGVPHLSADDELDLATTLGWLHANDRLFQMELARRACAGRLAEVAGPAALARDRQALALRLRATAERLVTVASPEARRWLDAYAAGVNGWLAGGASLPPELRLLGVRPEPWQPADSLCLVMLMGVDLTNPEVTPELANLAAVRALGIDRVEDYLGRGPLAAVPEVLALLPEGPEATAAVEPQVEELRGSNNWAVGAGKTASGAALVANDPHLGLRLPGTWYQVQMRAPNLELAGVTLPGLPVVVIGQNADLGWALTNSRTDARDLFVEQPDAEGNRVRRGEDWLSLDRQTVEIPVKDAEPVVVELLATEIGPYFPAVPDEGRPLPFSLAWSGHLDSDPMAAFLRLARASTLEELPEGLGDFVSPPQNLVVGHRDGGVLQMLLGRLPQRGLGDSYLLLPAWDPAYHWQGLRPVTDNPTILRPAESTVVTANHDVRPAEYEVPYPGSFATSARADRIRQRLAERSDWQAASLAELQPDTVSLYARRLVTLVDGEYEGDAARALERLRAWDGDAAGEGASALYLLLERELIAAIFDDEIRHHGLGLAPRWRHLRRLLEGEMSAAWFDDVTTPAVETREEVLAGALESAWRAAEERWGGVDGWALGELQPLHLRHPLGGLAWIGPRLNRGPFPVAGSRTSINAFYGPWEGELKPSRNGPSMRWVGDTAEPDRSLLVLPGGQSGHPWDAHYDDQLPLFLDGQIRSVAWSEAAIAAATVSELVLRPRADGTP